VRPPASAARCPSSRNSVTLVLGAVLVGSVTLAGCSEQECFALPCPFRTAVSLTVVDAVDGGPVANPVANGLPCGTSGLCIPLRADGGTIGAGTSSIDVTAAGYGHLALDVTVPAATPDPCSCQGDYVPQTRDVFLAPL
jgi:hypothetical protein